MNCSRCGYNNKEGAQFCIKCGQRFYYATPGGTSIGTTLRDGMLLQGRYKILRQLGKGGMGVVYLTSDNRFTNRTCVVKEMMEFLLNENEKQKALLRFNQEADLLATINHPNVPQVYDRFSENDRHYLVMEFVEGMDLKNLLQEYMKEYNSPIPEQDLIVFFMQLCLILKYLHNHKPVILHRDIKPSNILLTNEGRAKLVDFGIAKAIQTNTQGTSIGTQGYAAPEQYKGLSDNRTDIYALGATLHHLLTGRDPQLEAPFDYPPVINLNNSVSQGISDIVEWMLQMNIECRPQSVDRIIERLKTLCPEIEQKVLNYSVEDNKLIEIINKKSNSKENICIVKNICALCGHENKPTSRFCVKCGKPVGSSSTINAAPYNQAVNNTSPISPYAVPSNNFSERMFIPPNHRINYFYPDGFKETIKTPDRDGSVKINTILERCFIDGAEYIYITEKTPYIDNQEVVAYSVVRNPQGVIQYIRPASDPTIKAKLYAHWVEVLNRY